jgi:hypothetical protein
MATHLGAPDGEYGEEGEAKRAVVEKQLWTWNVAMGVLHLVQAIIVLAASQSVGNLKAFKIPLITAMPKWEQGFPMPAFQLRGELPFVAVTSGFAFLSAAAHFAVLIGFKRYLKDLKEEQINRFRWYEYALSSSLMIALIAMLFGMWDCISLVLLASVNACMCLFGMDHELLNGKRAAEHVQWEPFWYGCFAGVVPWAAIIAYLAASPSLSRVPPFVWAIVGFHPSPPSLPPPPTLRAHTPATPHNPSNRSASTLSFLTPSR